MHKNTWFLNFDVLPTVHLSLFISVINQLDAQNFCLVHETATYKFDDTRGCLMQFWPPDDEHMCSKHVEAWNKLVKQKFCASSWLITEIKNIWFLIKMVLTDWNLTIFFILVSDKNTREARPMSSSITVYSIRICWKANSHRIFRNALNLLSLRSSLIPHYEQWLSHISQRIL